MTATRIVSNFYSISGVGVGVDAIVQTKFCFEFAFSANATLVMTGASGFSDGTIAFAGGASCTVAGAYRPRALVSGLYAANLTSETSSFFSDAAASSIIRASSLCLAVRAFDNATLNLTYAGGIAYSGGFNIGSITFSNGSTCALVGIYGLAKLN